MTFGRSGKKAEVIHGKSQQDISYNENPKKSNKLLGFSNRVNIN